MRWHPLRHFWKNLCRGQEKRFTLFLLCLVCLYLLIKLVNFSYYPVLVSWFLIIRTSLTLGTLSQIPESAIKSLLYIFGLLVFWMQWGMNGERSIETYTLPHVKLDSQCKFAIWCMGLEFSFLWQHKGIRYGERWNGGSRQRGRMYSYFWFMLTYGRNQHNTAKQLTSN